MPNPLGINQYSKGKGGGAKKGRSLKIGDKMSISGNKVNYGSKAFKAAAARQRKNGVI